MPAVHVRDLPEEVLEALKRRAAAHRRSLQMELRENLDRAAREAPPAVPLPSAAEELRMASSGPQDSSTWTRDEIYGDDGR